MKNTKPSSGNTELFANTMKCVLCCLFFSISISAWSGRNPDKNFLIGISQHPVSVSICTGSPAGFSVVATGSGTLGYQWQESTNGGSSFNNILPAGIYILRIEFNGRIVQRKIAKTYSR